jgi:hypothetical protein
MLFWRRLISAICHWGSIQSRNFCAANAKGYIDPGNRSSIGQCFRVRSTPLAIDQDLLVSSWKSRSPRKCFGGFVFHGHIMRPDLADVHGASEDAEAC